MKTITRMFGLAILLMSIAILVTFTLYDTSNSDADIDDENSNDPPYITILSNEFYKCINNNGYVYTNNICDFERRTHLTVNASYLGTINDLPAYSLNETTAEIRLHVRASGQYSALGNDYYVASDSYQGNVLGDKLDFNYYLKNEVGCGTALLYDSSSNDLVELSNYRPDDGIIMSYDSQTCHKIYGEYYGWYIEIYYIYEAFYKSPQTYTYGTTPLVINNPNYVESYSFYLINSADLVEKVSIDGINYEISNRNSAKVQSGDYSGTVTIPSSINISFENDTSKIIPVTSISDDAFYDCSNIVAINLPSSIEEISCSFNKCPSLTSININDNNEVYKSINGVLFNKESLSLLRYPEGKTDTTYTLPDIITDDVANTKKVTSINSYAFYGCTHLNSVKIGNNITSIGNNAFEHCCSLKYIEISATLTDIGASAFSLGTSSKNALCRVNNLSSFDLENYINDYTELIYDYLKIDKPIAVVNEYTYDSKCKSIIFDGITNKITVSNNEKCDAGVSNVLVSINDTYLYAWSDGTQEPLTFELWIKEKPISIIADEISLYYYDDEPIYTATITGLLNNDIYEGYLISCDYTKGTDGICQITVSGPKTYGNYTAEYHNNTLTILREFTSNGCKYHIQDDGFSLSLVNSNTDILALPNEVYRDTYTYKVTNIVKGALPEYITDITLCANIKDLDITLFNESRLLKTISVDNANIHYSSIDGILFDKNKETLIRCPINYDTKEYMIPSSVKILSDDAFDNCFKIEKIVIQEDLKSIGKQPFIGCSSLKEISVSEHNGNYVSYNGILCNEYSIIRCPEGKEGSITFNEMTTITTVCNNAFQNCTELTKICLGNNITTITDDAFKGCLSITIQAFGITGTVNTGIDNIENVKAFVTGGVFTYSDGTEVNNISCPSFDVKIDNNIIGSIHIPDVGYSVKVENSLLCTYYGNSCVESLNLISYISSEEYFDEPKIDNGTVILEVLGSSFSITFISGDVSNTLKYGQDGILHNAIPNPYLGAPKGCIAYWPEFEYEMSVTQTVRAVYESYLTYEPYSQKNITTTRASGTMTVTGLNNNVDIWYSQIQGYRYIDIPDTTLDGQYIVSIQSIEDHSLIEINIGPNVHDISAGAFNKCTALRNITVQSDNPTYASVNSSLLSNDGRILYAIPYNNGNTFNLPDSVTKIETNAICGNVCELTVSNARNIQFETCCNCSGHSISIIYPPNSNIRNISINILESDNTKTLMTVEKKDAPLAENIGLNGSIIELIILIICAILVFITIIHMGEIGVNPEQKNLYIPVFIATIADISMFIFLLLCSQAEVSVLFTILWVLGAIAVILETISTYSLYMYKISKDDLIVASTYKKRGRILTYIGELIGIVSAIFLILAVTAFEINVNSDINMMIILISITYIIVEGLIISTIYRAFDNTKAELNNT